MTAFSCARCGQDKRSKLLTVAGNDWSRILCNGCYGRLLSIWEIKSGSLDDIDRFSELHRLLMGLVGADEVARSTAIIHARDDRAKRLSPEAITVLATAEAVASSLSLIATELDWSAAVIGLCKAVEIEAIRLVVDPVKTACTQINLERDMKHNGTRPLARYCAGLGTPPELGTLARVITAIVTPQEAAPIKDGLTVVFQILGRRWPASDWLLPTDGFPAALTNLTRNYRNPAAHTQLLNSSDYDACNSLVQGTDGILWKLMIATSTTGR